MTSSPPEPALMLEVGDLTPERLGAALGSVVHTVRVEPIGTGQIGRCLRLELTGDDVPSSIVAKLPSSDPSMRSLLAGAYRGEVRFYTDIAHTVSVRAPVCYHAALGDNGDFTLLLEDLAPSQQGDQVAGCTPSQAHDAVRNLAGLHGPRWCDPTLLHIPWLGRTDEAEARMLTESYGPALETFADGLGDLLSDTDHTTLRACVEVTEQWLLARPERFAPTHGDYRLDNLMFPVDSDTGVVAVDWQTLTIGLPARDLAYFLGTGMTSELRRDHEHDLVATYHRALLGHGIEHYSLTECWEDYRFAMLQGPLVAVFGCAYGTRTDRGDRMFATMVARACTAIRDLDSLTLAATSYE